MLPDIPGGFDRVAYSRNNQGESINISHLQLQDISSWTMSALIEMLPFMKSGETTVFFFDKTNLIQRIKTGKPILILQNIFR